MANDRDGGSRIGFGGLLSIAFITLRLCGVIDWPWWLVLLPLWGPLAVALAILAAIALIDRARRR